jgi:hypothetical protein
MLEKPGISPLPDGTLKFKSRKANLLAGTWREMLDPNLPFDCGEIQFVADLLTRAQHAIAHLYKQEEARVGKPLHNIPGKLQLLEAIRFIYEAKVELTNAQTGVAA